MLVHTLHGMLVGVVDLDVLDHLDVLGVKVLFLVLTDHLLLLFIDLVHGCHSTSLVLLLVHLPHLSVLARQW